MGDFNDFLGSTDRLLYGLFDLMNKTKDFHFLIVGGACAPLGENGLNKRAFSRLELKNIPLRHETLSEIVESLERFVSVEHLNSSLLSSIDIDLVAKASLVEAASAAHKLLHAYSKSKRWRNAAAENRELHWFLLQLLES